MATLAQLRAEPEWGREIVTDELDWLADQLCARLNRPRTAAGTRGDVGHLYGGHRSQEWILRSVWCRNRTYTVQRGLTATQARHIAALDITPDEWGSRANRTAVTAITRRLVAAGKAGRLPGVWEVIGTLDGRTPVGVDLPEGQTWPADESHLEHVHKTFDRRRLQDRAVMERVLAVVLGEDDDMDLGDRVPWVTAGQWERVRKLPGLADDAAGLSIQQILTYVYEFSRGADTKANDALKEAAQAGKLAAEAVELLKAGGGNPDLAPILARIDALATTVTGLAAAVAAIQADEDGLRAKLAAAYGAGA